MRSTSLSAGQSHGITVRWHQYSQPVDLRQEALVIAAVKVCVNALLDHIGQTEAAGLLRDHNNAPGWPQGVGRDEHLHEYAAGLAQKNEMPISADHLCCKRGWEIRRNRPGNSLALNQHCG
ncbi:MAG: hypothetical protein ABWY05_08835 [Noviherbaspirillum sp.]